MHEFLKDILVVEYQEEAWNSFCSLSFVRK